MPSHYEINYEQIELCFDEEFLHSQFKEIEDDEDFFTIEVYTEEEMRKRAPCLPIRVGKSVKHLNEVVVEDGYSLFIFRLPVMDDRIQGFLYNTSGLSPYNWSCVVEDNEDGGSWTTRMEILSSLQQKYQNKKK